MKLTNLLSTVYKLFLPATASMVATTLKFGHLTLLTWFYS